MPHNEKTFHQNEYSLPRNRMSLKVVCPNPEFDKLKTVAQQYVSKKWTVDQVISLGGVLAAEANKFSSLSGSQKKQLVCDVLRDVLNESVKVSTDQLAPVSKEELAQLLFVVDSVLPASLDLAISAARGKLDLKKVKKTCFSSLLLCLPFVTSKLGASSAQSGLVIRQLKEVAAKVDPSLVEVEVESAPAPEPQPEESKESVPHVQTNPLVESEKAPVEQTETPEHQSTPSEAEAPREEVKTPDAETQTA